MSITGKRVLLISDSICKYIENIDWLESTVLPGANIFTIHNFIKGSKARINLFTHLILHVGTNDIANGLTNDLIYQYYLNLLVLVKSITNCNIIISAILPRPVDFTETKQRVIEVNKHLATLAFQKKFLFIRTYKPFVQQPGSIPIRKYFAKDGLHLSFTGVSVLRNFLIGVVNHLN